MIMWRIDPSAGSNHKTNKVMAVARQQILNEQQLSYNNGGTVGTSVFCMVCPKELYNEDTSRTTVS
jgi:hypothetical protein